MDFEDDQQQLEMGATWIIVGAVGGLLFMMSITVFICLIWNCIIRQPRDSLDDLEEQQKKASYSQRLRQWRRNKGKTRVLGVKQDSNVTKSAASGYRWKRKWRDRKAKSKEKRKIKHAERKKRRAQKAAERTKSSTDASDPSSDGDSSTNSSPED